MTVAVLVINAFSLDGKGGNPAGVVVDADQFSAAQKQQLASSAGFPETAFVSASEVADYKLEFFTPIKQIPHCGHATIATFFYLRQQGLIKDSRSSKETIDGCRTILFDGDDPFMEQGAPTFHTPEAEMAGILNSLGITEKDLIPGLSPTIVNTGNAFLIVPLRNQSILKSISYDRNGVKQISEKYGLIGYYLYAYPETKAYDATTRMFAPAYGIDEEAATGMAAGPLAAFLHQIERKHKVTFDVQQGIYMSQPSPSKIRVRLEVEDLHIRRLYAGGSAYVSGEKTIEI